MSSVTPHANAFMQENVVNRNESLFLLMNLQDVSMHDSDLDGSSGMFEAQHILTGYADHKILCLLRFPISSM